MHFLARKILGCEPSRRVRMTSTNDLDNLHRPYNTTSLATPRTMAMIEAFLGAGSRLCTNFLFLFLSRFGSCISFHF